jgi:hypothetical protein
MRVSTRWFTYPTACGSGYDGEVEDYTINVGNLSTDNTSMDSAFNLWPNPNHGEFTVSLNSTNPQPTKLTVYDVAGRVIFKKYLQAQNNIQENVSLAKTQAGVYFVKVSDNNNSTTKKIIIQ